MGLLSSGGVHSEFKHILALIDMAKQLGQTQVYLHLFTDGRDCDTKHSLVLIKKIASLFKQGWSWKNCKCNWQILCYGQR